MARHELCTLGSYQQYGKTMPQHLALRTRIRLQQRRTHATADSPIPRLLSLSQALRSTRPPHRLPLDGALPLDLPWLEADNFFPRRCCCCDRVAVSSFRGTVQASSTRITSFRVVWRGDAFTTPQDAPGTTMFSQGWWPSSGGSSGGGRGRRPQFQPGPVLSQDDELAVPREDACALAAWAKSEFPSVTSSSSSEAFGRQAAAAAAAVASSAASASGGSGSLAPAFAGSLGAVRVGVEISVRACVLEASKVEWLWLWEYVGGKGKGLFYRKAARAAGFLSP